MRMKIAGYRTRLDRNECSLTGSPVDGSGAIAPHGDVLSSLIPGSFHPDLGEGRGGSQHDISHSPLVPYFANTVTPTLTSRSRSIFGGTGILPVI
jgi:hypothetical protein